MDRRIFLAMLALLPSAAGGVRAAELPWRSRFLDGGFDGVHYWSGLSVTMSKGWKTYWRVPGAGGIPPELIAQGSNLKSAELLFPVPQRFYDESGESIGYKDEVIFPIKLSPLDGMAPLEVKFSSFFGVCEVVCIPAQSEATLRFAMGSSSSADATLVADWRQKLPTISPDGPVVSATVAVIEGKPGLEIHLNAPADDVFIAGSDKYYFHAPKFEGRRVTLSVSGAKSAEELKGLSLRLLAVRQGKGLEQTILVL